MKMEMKMQNKVILFVATALTAILVMPFFVSNAAQAVSGGCSNHGGVDCSAGADWDSSVVCNDGWEDDKMQYSERCNPDSFDPFFFGFSCKNDSDISALQNYLIQFDKEYTPQQVSDILNQCTCRSSDGIYSYYDLDRNKCFCKSGYGLYNGKCTEKNLMCQDKHGANSFASGDLCFCKNGYLFSESLPQKCITLEEYCRETSGINSHVRTTLEALNTLDNRIATQYCRCNEGYEIKIGKCVEMEWKKISVRAKQWVDNYNYSCKNDDVGLSEQEMVECLYYQLHKSFYNWEVYVPSPKIVPIVPKIIPQPTSEPTPKPSPMPQPKQEVKSVSVALEQKTKEAVLEEKPSIMVMKSEPDKSKTQNLIANVSGAIKGFFKRIFSWF